MHVDQFLAEFGHIASAPHGIKTLRTLILNLAVSGRLTVQYPNEKVSVLLEDIGKKRKQLRIQGETREIKKLQSIPSELPWKLPANWDWVRFSELCSFASGRTPSRQEGRYWNTGDYPWFSIADMVHGKTIYKSRETVSEVAKLDVFKCESVKAGSLLMSFKLSIGRLSILGVDGFHNEAIIAIYPFDQSLRSYFLTCMSVFVLTVKNKAAIKGYTLNRASISNILIALPPREEIIRIVNKIDELMFICDKLEAQQQEREKLCKITRTATLHALANAEDSLKLELAWARTNANMSLLLDCEQGFIDLQYSLTKLAVRGFLSNWTKESSPLAEIKEECSSLKQEYIYRGWLRTRKPIAPKLHEHENDAYPSHWGILPLDEVAVIIGGITKGHTLRGKDVRSCLYLSVANVQRGFFDLTEMKRIEVPVHQIEKYRVESGDLLIVEGGDWDKVGRTAIWAGELPDCLHQNHIFKARVPSSVLLNEWVELVLNSEIGRDYFAGASKQTTNLASINMTQLRSFPLPIPPISEQIAILQKVNHLLSICQKLKQQRFELYDVAQMLATAAISSITGIQIEDKEKVKVPKTKLVSTLRVGVSPANSERAPLAAILIRNNEGMPAKTLWQTSRLEIDAFYQQLKIEMARGWIVQPKVAYMREVEAS